MDALIQSDDRYRIRLDAPPLNAPRNLREREFIKRRNPFLKESPVARDQLERTARRFR